MPSRKDDERFMRRALRLAERGRGFVEPNPVVGCVIVKDGRIIAEGWHRRFGGPHAEIEALSNAAEDVHGLTMYVSLEPCCHHGKTGPCTEAIIAAGLKRIVAACFDPFEQVSGQGVRRLREAGVEVDTGICETEAQAANAPFFKRIRSGLPYVIAKWAATVDGAIATATGESRWISNERSRAIVHRLRARMDAIVVGIGTVLADDPLLTARHVRIRRVARRIVIDPALRLPAASKLARTARQTPVTVMTGMMAAPARIQALEEAGIEVVTLPQLDSGRLDLAAGLHRIAQEHGAANILVEGGGRTHGTFLEQGLVDEVLVFTGPSILGDPAAMRPVVGSQAGPMRIDAAQALKLVECRRLDDDVMLRYRLTAPSSGS